MAAEKDENMTDTLQPVIDLARADARIAALYVLGSRANGTARPDSDLDLAILLMPGVKLDAAEQLDLAAAFSSASRQEVDLGMLGTSNVVYAKEVAENGQPLLIKDRGATDLFFATALGQYAALREQRRPVERAYGAA